MLCWSFSCKAHTIGNLPCHDSIDQYHTKARTKTGDSFHTGFATSQCSNHDLPSFWHRTQFDCFTISHNSYVRVACIKLQWCVRNDIHNAVCATVIIM